MSRTDERQRSSESRDHGTGRGDAAGQRRRVDLGESRRRKSDGRPDHDFRRHWLPGHVVSIAPESAASRGAPAVLNASGGSSRRNQSYAIAWPSPSWLVLHCARTSCVSCSGGQSTSQPASLACRRRVENARSSPSSTRISCKTWRGSNSSSKHSRITSSSTPSEPQTFRQGAASSPSLIGRCNPPRCTAGGPAASRRGGPLPDA